MHPESTLRLERIANVSARTGVSKTKIYQLVGQGLFPRPVKVGTATYWVVEEIERWIKAQMVMRDGHT